MSSFVATGRLHVQELLPEAVVQIVLAEDAELLAGGASVQNQYDLELASGARSYISTRFAIRDEQGRASAVGSIGLDVTEQLAAREKIHQLNTELEARVVRRIVESLGGRIWIEEAPGGGSDFMFTTREA